jgi:hypothetical protein
MDKVICQICEKEFKDHGGLHKHLKVHDLRVAEYYQQQHPRHDLYNGDLIKFKNKDQYFSTDFNSRTNLKMWLKSVSKGEAKRYCTKTLKARKTAKNLVYAPTQVELRTLMFPPIHYYNMLFDDYYELCEKIGLKNKYQCFGELITGAAYSKDDYKIYVDTREQLPLEFDWPTEPKALKAGDYALSDPKVTCNCHVERKSLSDFISTLSVRNYDRFEREIQRAEEGGIYLVILVEDTLNNALSFKYLPYISKKIRVTPEFIFRNVRVLIQKYPHIQFLFVKDREESSRVIKKIFFSGCIYKKIDLQLAYDTKKL